MTRNYETSIECIRRCTREITDIFRESTEFVYYTNFKFFKWIENPENNQSSINVKEMHADDMVDKNDLEILKYCNLTMGDPTRWIYANLKIHVLLDDNRNRVKEEADGILGEIYDGQIPKAEYHPEIDKGVFLYKDLRLEDFKCCNRYHN